jgi:hypothetical protein
VGCGRPGVGSQAGEDGVAEAPFEGAGRLFAGLSLGQFLLEAGAPVAVALADLGDRRQVDGVVEPAVPAPGQPAGLWFAAGDLDRRGAVAGGEVIAAREAGRVTGAAGDGGGDDGPAPDSPVRLVPVARTAVVSLLLVPRSWVPVRRRSSQNAAASSQRAASTAPAGVIEPGSSAA